MKEYVFIYTNGVKVKALFRTDAKEFEKSESFEGWKHTATLDTRVWIEYMLNIDCLVDVMSEVKDLTGRVLN